MKKLLLTLITCICLSGCAGCSSEDPNVPKITIVDDIKDCEPACTRAQELNCPEGEDLVQPGSNCSTDADCEFGICIETKCTEPCEMLCEAFVDQGIVQGLACWPTITNCEEIETVCKRN